jgi:hypothetical protein
MFKVIKNFMKHLGLGVGNFAVILLVWALTVGMWNFLVQYPVATMAILAGIPALVAVYYTAKDQIHAYRREK